MKALNTVFNVLKKVAPTLLKSAVPGSAIVFDLLSEVTGQKNMSPEAMAVEVVRNPKKLVELQKLANQREITFLQKMSKRIESVNQTMRVEAKQHKWAGMWRPFWGFASAISFGFCIIGIIALGAYGLAKGQTEMLEVIPNLVFAITSLFSIPGSIIGLASWHRGKQKRIEAGEKPGAGIMGIIQAMKGAK